MCMMLYLVTSWDKLNKRDIYHIMTGSDMMYVIYSYGDSNDKTLNLYNKKKLFKTTFLHFMKISCSSVQESKQPTSKAKKKVFYNCTCKRNLTFKEI